MANPVLQFKRGAAANVGVVSFKSGEPGFTTDKFDFYIGLDETVANNKFFGSARYWKRENGSNSAQVKLVDKDGTNFIGIAASDTLSGIATYRLPNTTNGTTDDFLKVKSVSNGFYDLEWTNALVAQTLKVNGNFYDSLNSNGGPGQFLVATGAGVTWTAIEGVSNGAISKVATTQTTDGSTYFLPFVANSTSTASETIRVDSGISYIPADDKLIVNGIGSFGNAYVSGISTLKSTTLIGGGTSTGTASQTLQVTGGAYVSGNLGIGSTNPTVKLWVEGSGRFIGSVTADSGFYVNGELIGGNISGDYITGTLLNITGVSTFSNGPVLIGGGTSTGTAGQVLQVTGISSGVYIGGNLGVGVTNPQATLQVGTAISMYGATGIVSATTFVGALTGTATSTTNIPNLTGAITSNNTTTSLGSFSSSDLASALTDETGSGSAVFATSPTLVTPALGNATATSLNVSGIVTASDGARFDGVQIGINGANVIDTVSGNLTLNSAGGTTIIDDVVTIQNNLTVNGNITVGGTTVTLRGTDVFIENKDIILGFTTSVTPDDDTANHAGVAIASTVGSPLVSFTASGINTLPDTYKQMMWFKSGTLGFSTDAFAFNYGVAIGTTTVANGVRLAVGSGITMTDTEVSATTFRGALSGTATSTTNIPNLTGDITSNGTTTSIASGVIVNDDINASAAIADTKLATISTALKVSNSATTATDANTASAIVARDGSGNFSAGTITASLTGTATSTTNIPNLTGAITSNNTTTSLGSFSSSNLSTALTDKTGSGVAVFATSPTLVTPALGDATAASINVSGITTTGTLKLSGTSGIGITGISSSTSLVENSHAYLPTQAAVKAYVDAVDVTLGINADTGGPSTINTSQTLTISGTTSEIETSVSGQTITIGLPNDIVVGTSLSSPTVKATNLKAADGTTSITITNATGAVGITSDLTVTGNLYVNGTTTQVNTASMTVEDRTIELGRVDGNVPGTDTTWDLGILFNYRATTAKKSGVIWEQESNRFKFAKDLTDGGQEGVSNPQITFIEYSPIEIASLWVNNTCTASPTEVISCFGGSQLEIRNVLIDAGTF
jgi:hypothetical protein